MKYLKFLKLWTFLWSWWPSIPGMSMLSIEQRPLQLAKFLSLCDTLRPVSLVYHHLRHNSWHSTSFWNAKQDRYQEKRFYIKSIGIWNKWNIRVLYETVIMSREILVKECILCTTFTFHKMITFRVKHIHDSSSAWISSAFKIKVY
jgi:hypothetical protein